jgi:hypothetical protein
MRTTPWVSCRTPGMRPWTHSMPKSRTLSMRKSRNWKRPLPAMSRAGNLRRSLLPWLISTRTSTRWQTPCSTSL